MADSKDAGRGTRCQRRTLAGDSTLGVEMCSCGHVHLHVQALTVRLDGAAFENLTAVMGEALRTWMLAHREPGRGAPLGTAWTLPSSDEVG